MNEKKEHIEKSSGAERRERGVDRLLLLVQRPEERYKSSEGEINFKRK